VDVPSWFGAGLYSATRLATDYWPNTLYDAREGAFRDVATAEAMRMAGVMQYISLDVANLKRWLAGAIPAVGPTGTQTLNQNGYIVYFSDRRGDHNESDGDVETGEFGFEDLINPAASAWAKSNALEAGEDVNARPEDENYMPTLEIYGETPHALAMPTGALAPNGTSATNVRPLTFLTAHPQARVNRVVLFRRALKLINGGIVGGVNRLPDDGLTVASENAIYVQGNYNATTSVTANPHVPASVIGDAVSLLSNNWLDARSLGTAANDVQGRPATTTGYRFAMVSGRGVPFLRPTAWTAQALWGTDGGVHNFMRMLEDWQPAAGFQDTNYRGSMVGLYNSRQLTGTFKLNNNVFVQGNRNFNFDVDFLDPALLPPGTPMFRDINTLRFRQILRPNQ